MTIKVASGVGLDGVDVLASDATGFPWCVWYEDRPSGRVGVSCAIIEGLNGSLMFRTTGSPLTNPIYSERPWENLVGFRAIPASELYYSGFDKRLKQEFMNQSVLFRLFLPDDAVVMTAEFADDHSSVPMHLNYGIGSPIEIVELHDALHHRFITQRRAVVDAICYGEFKWPEEFNGPATPEFDARTRAIEAAIIRLTKRRGLLGKLFG